MHMFLVNIEIRCFTGKSWYQESWTLHVIGCDSRKVRTDLDVVSHWVLNFFSTVHTILLWSQSIWEQWQLGAQKAHLTIGQHENKPPIQGYWCRAFYHAHKEHISIQLWRLTIVLYLLIGWLMGNQYAQNISCSWTVNPTDSTDYGCGQSEPFILRNLKCFPVT